MKKLACRLGRHEWTSRVEGGESYKVCAACGKFAARPEHSGLPGWAPDSGRGGGNPGEAPSDRLEEEEHP
jgi:hypothetical protein